MTSILFRLINKWGKSKLYHATNGDLVIPFTVEHTKDKIGILYRVECSKCGYFEEYGMGAVKERISKLFN